MRKSAFALPLARFLIVALPVWPVSPARACMSYELNSVHFNANKPDFGLLPRRASVASRGEHDSRPASEDYSAPGEYRGLEFDSSREQEHIDKRAAETARALASAQT